MTGTMHARPVMTSTNPATGEIMATWPVMDDVEIETALARAETAYRAWRLTSFEDRAHVLRRLAEAYATHREKLARIATREMGKLHAAALAEVDKCASCLAYYGEHGERLLAPETHALSTGRTAELHWLPMGPVLAVMPWNFPYWQVVRFLAPTLMGGNVGLLKHAAIVQGCAEAMAEMMVEAGAPEGLFQNLGIRAGQVAGVIADDRVVAVTLTGSEDAGRQVAAQAGQALKKVVLELGGSDPFIVLPSADLDAAVKAAVVARVQNGGQSCVCGKRMIVHTDVYDEFAGRFAAALAAVRVGDPMDLETEMGPLSSIEQRDTVLAQVQDARMAGATVHGAEMIEGEGAYMRAGVITGLDPASPLMAEEIFGPVALMFRARDRDEAIRIANAIPYGLGASVWTRDEEDRRICIRDIEAGMTAFNQITASSPEVPFGGIKRSGHGRELGKAGLTEFLNLKTVFLG